MNIDDKAAARATNDWPMRDLGQAIYNLWNPFGTRIRVTEGQMTQAQHIREFGEPFGSNGA